MSRSYIPFRAVLAAAAACDVCAKKAAIRWSWVSLVARAGVVAEPASAFTMNCFPLMRNWMLTIFSQEGWWCWFRKIHVGAVVVGAWVLYWFAGVVCVCVFVCVCVCVRVRVCSAQRDFLVEVSLDALWCYDVGRKKKITAKKVSADQKMRLRLRSRFFWQFFALFIKIFDCFLIYIQNWPTMQDQAIF